MNDLSAPHGRPHPPAQPLSNERGVLPTRQKPILGHGKLLVLLDQHHVPVAAGLERLSDPRVGFVTLTGVEVAPDLRTAKVFYSVLAKDSEGTAETLAALRSAAPHLRAILGQQVRLKYLPHLTFLEDPAIAHGQRVEEILRSLHRNERQEGS